MTDRTPRNKLPGAFVEIVYGEFKEKFDAANGDGGANVAGNEVGDESGRQGRKYAPG